jgi:hypothetical protein
LTRVNWCPPLELVLEDDVSVLVDAAVVATVLCGVVILVPVAVLVVFAAAFVVVCSTVDVVDSPVGAADDDPGALQLRRRFSLPAGACLSPNSIE